MTVSITKEILNLISQMGGAGTLTSSIHEQFYGMNSLGTQITVPLDRDHFGLTFFTRPRLNLSDGNLRVHRPFLPMLALNGDRATLPMAIRAMLDPVGVWSRGETCPLVDNRQAYLPILTNTIQSATGWPDFAPATYVSDEGNHHEQWGMIDDTIKHFRSWQMNANFRNSIGDSILFFFYVWVAYAALVKEGDMYPYPDAVIEDEIDYVSSCIRFRLDETRTRITQWGSTICYPKTVPVGSTMNFSADSPINDEGRIHSIGFDCFGFEWNDPVILKEFNVRTEFFNIDMHDNYREERMRLLHTSEWALFNYRTYFRVNLDSLVLERWVDKDVYDVTMKQVGRLYGNGS